MKYFRGLNRGRPYRLDLPEERKTVTKLVRGKAIEDVESRTNAVSKSFKDGLPRAA